MKLKLDENLGDRGRLILEDAGHDVRTVPEQGLTSAIDEKLYSVCVDEDRALVTLDLDFSNPLRFPPERSAGIAVLRLPKSPSADDLTKLLKILIAGIELRENLTAHLWIIEVDRIRVYEPDS